MQNVCIKMAFKNKYITGIILLKNYMFMYIYIFLYYTNIHS